MNPIDIIKSWCNTCRNVVSQNFVKMKQLQSDPSSIVSVETFILRIDDTLEEWIKTNLVTNSYQWILEEIIRDPTMEANNLVGIKKQIDHSNQLRNDTMEHIDECILKLIGSNLNENSKPFSESPGSILDRINIQFLKLHFYSHQKGNMEALQRGTIAQNQISHLRYSLMNLLEDVISGNGYFITFRQLKAYNEAQFNKYLHPEKSNTK